MPKKHNYEKLRVEDSLRGRIQLCIVDTEKPHKDVTTIYGMQPAELQKAKLLCESWNAVVTIAERLGEDPLKVAGRLKRGELVES